MAEPISIQQLKDASLDVKSLEEVVNGDENVVVTTRLGETYPSVKGSIKTLFENGGLPATPFETKALMTASPLVDGKYAIVTDGGADNGLYVKTAGVWVKSSYDPLSLAKNADLVNEQRVRNQNYVSVEMPSKVVHHADAPAALVDIAKGSVIYDSSTKMMYVSSDTIMYPPSGGFETIIGGRKIDLNPVLATTSLARVYFNLTTKEFEVIKGTTNTTALQQANLVLFCSVRHSDYYTISIGSNFRYYVDASPYGIPIHQERPWIIVGNSNYQGSINTINYDTANNTLTLPYDTLIGYRDRFYTITPDTILDFKTVTPATSALKVYFNVVTNTFVLLAYNKNLSFAESYQCVLFCVVRDRYYRPSSDGAVGVHIDITAPYTINGKIPSSDSATGASSDGLNASVKAIAHRGYSNTAPENTLPSYILAKQNGFTYVETDIEFTSDNIPVLLHDATIDRTSNGTGAISSMTLATAKTYDFGAWKNARYAGTKIPTLKEFLQLCHRQSLHPYLEIKSGATATTERIQMVVDTVRDTGMRGKVTYICFQLPVLVEIQTMDAEARLGYVINPMTNASVDAIATLKTADNEVFIDAKYSGITEPLAQYAHSKKVPIESWTIASDDEVLRLVNLGVSGIATDGLDVQAALNAVDGI